MILTITCMAWTSQVADAQQIESKPARIKLNNLQEMHPVSVTDAQGPDASAPEIKLISPSIAAGGVYSSDSDMIDLIGEVTDQGGVKFVSVNSDIRSINDAGIFSTRLQLEPGENKVRIMASDLESNLNEQFFTVLYYPPKLSLSDKIKQESNYYGLVIGINKYEDPDLQDLDNPIKDAENLHRALLENYTFKPEDMVLLKNPERDEIVFALDDLSKKVTPDDNVLIFYAGHGYWDERSNVGYWLPSDSYMSNTANWFRNSTLVDYLKSINSKHTLLITDACFAGSIFKTRSGFAKPDRAFEVLYDQSSRKAMTSGALTEVPDRSYFTAT